MRQEGLCCGIVRGLLLIHSSGQTVFSHSHIERITMGAGEDVDEVAGGASVMGVDRIGGLVSGLVKDRLLVCMGQVLQWGLWQGKDPGMGRGGWEARLVLTRS